MADEETGLSKHAQTAIQVILVAITIWVGSSIIALRDSSIRAEEKYTTMRESLIELKAEIAALRVAIAAGAEKDLAASQNMRDIQARVSTNSNRIDTLERKGQIRGQ